MSLILEQVRFAFDSARDELFDGLDLHFAPGWTGVVGPSGSGKTTLLRLAVGELTPQAGRVVGAMSATYCPQRTDDPPPGLGALIESTEAEAYECRGRLGVEDDHEQRWSTLSHGERKRAQIACALFAAPEVLAVDEPTNHLDAPARRQLQEALTHFGGVGLLVSHDRELLDALCARCLFLDPPSVVIRPGGYSQGREEQRREEASRADGRRSKRGIARKDHDRKARIDAARNSGQDGAAGRRSQQLAARVERAGERVEAARHRKDRDLGIAWKGERSRRDRVLRVAATTLALGGDRHLDVPELEIGGADRIALVGPNGAGKSTLVRHLLEHVEISPDRLSYVPQELPATEAGALVRRVCELPGALRGELMMVVSRLGSDPRRVLQTDLPSPGEARKLLFALGRVQEPELIVMDEPTNHLDLPSVECLEEALAGCPCALLLVSHDEAFLRKLTETRWVLGVGGGVRRERWPGS